ncbi:MAG: MBL fold metallo-hydrolase RNA specificity domain-containing protein [Cetobacterium sp.]
MRTCKVCGKQEKPLRDDMCKFHYEQVKKYGFIVSDASHIDENEIVLHSEYAELNIYDTETEHLRATVKIDLDDIDEVNNYTWRKGVETILSKDINGNTIMLKNVIADDFESNIRHINGDYLDCRKSNLELIKKQKKVKKVNKKNKGKIKITSIGGSTIDVTGSCFSIEYDKDDGTRGLFLIECGMIQGGTVLEDYNANKRMVDAIPFEEAEFILMGHAHCDHIALLPGGIQRGFTGDIVLTKESAAISEKLLLDSSFIQERNIKELNKRGKKLKSLYSESDCYLTFNKYKVVNKNEMIKLNENVSVRYINNSHCYGASQIEIFIKKPSNHISKIVYTSDLGSSLNLEFQPFVEKNEKVNKADILICESTYGLSNRGFTRSEALKEREQVIQIVKDTISTKTRCLIPSFSFQRSQTVMIMLYEALKDLDIKDTMIVVDSRLTNEINNVYLNTLEGKDREYFKEVLSWDRFKFIDSYKDTEKLLVRRDCPMIIISSSGMVDNGHSKDWAKSLLTRKGDTICFIGYCGKNTLGNKIQNENQKTITIDGVVYAKKCNIKIFSTFSSHIQRNELIDYFKHINIGKSILLHHGSKEAKYELKEEAKKELSRVGKTTKITVVDKGCDEFIL